jgi:hypothetical protein
MIRRHGGVAKRKVQPPKPSIASARATGRVAVSDTTNSYTEYHNKLHHNRAAEWGVRTAISLKQRRWQPTLWRLGHLCVSGGHAQVS